MSDDDERTAEERETERRAEERGDDEQSDGAALLERVVVAVSVLLIASTLGYVLWQASVTTEVADPEVNIQSIETMEGGERLRVTVELDNRRGPGLALTQVAVECGGTEHEMEFEHVPAGGRRTGTVTCPAGSEPEAIVETWKDA